MADLFFDGGLIGKINNPETFTSLIKKARRNGKLDRRLNICYTPEKDVVDIFLCRNRIRRPLIIVENGISLLKQEHLMGLKNGELKWSDLISMHIIEYLDAAEEENTLIAMRSQDITKEHTHLEIDPATILGISAVLVPYCNYSPSSRLLRGQKTQKQGMSFYALNYPIRTDTNIDVIHHPQKPIVGTFMQGIIGPEKAAGQNIVVAVMNYEGYNMEDAIIINRQSIERCFGRSTHYRPYVAERRRYYGGQTDDLVVPDKEVQGYTTEEDYRFLDEDGIVYKEAKLSGGEVLIGRASPPRFLSKLGTFSTAANIRKDTSVRVRHSEEGLATDILLTENGEGNLLVKVKMRDPRNIEVGDKFSARSGQKGVVGLLKNSKDLPFSENGIVPDIIFSPNSLTGRMTINYLFELLGGKVGALQGEFIDGSPFESEDLDSLKAKLRKLGFEENGTEILYDGRTGKRYESRIFIGTTYYLRLHHQVRDKLQARARGPIQLLTRQPTEGKAKEGGTRFGEMEKETLVGHGTSLLLKERFDSDKTIIYACDKCGDIAMHSYYKKKPICESCGGKSKVYPLEISYAFKLFLDELKSLYIRPILNLKNKY